MWGVFMLWDLGWTESRCVDKLDRAGQVLLLVCISQLSRDRVHRKVLWSWVNLVPADCLMYWLSVLRHYRRCVGGRYNLCMFLRPWCGCVVLHVLGNGCKFSKKNYVPQCV